MPRSCTACDGTGRIQWTSPPHRGDPRYSYACLGCSGTGDPDKASFILTKRALAYLNDPPRGSNAAWVKPKEKPQCEPTSG